MDDNVLVYPDVYDWIIDHEEEESATFLESFDSWDDAVLWVEGLMMKYPDPEYILEECRINYLGMKFRAGVTFKRSQYEMFRGCTSDG